MAAGRALVVGAGISGLTTAIGLSTQGWDVEVHDRGDAIDSRGAALGIWPHAWRGLERLGVTELLTDTFDYTDATIRSPTGTVLGHLPLGTIARRNGAPVRLVTRPALVQALVRRLDACGGAEISLRTTYDGDRDPGAYDLVVGADGINSRVRRRLAPGVEPRPLGATAWRGSCDGLVGGWGEIWGRGVFAGVTPAGRTRTNWYVPVSDRHHVTSFDEVRELVKDWPAALVAALERTSEDAVLRHPLHDLPALDSYVDGNHVLVGDAAHAMAPSLGQGACQAIVDALALTRALGSRRTVALALAAYDDSQRRAGTRLVRRSRMLLRMQLSPTMAPVRDSMLRLFRPLAPR